MSQTKRHLDKNDLAALEYDKILDILSAYASTESGKSLAETLIPSNNMDTVEYMLRESEDALSVLVSAGIPPLHGIDNISSGVKRAYSGSSLSCSELLKIRYFLYAITALRGFRDNHPSIQDNILMGLIEKTIPLPELYKRLVLSIGDEEEVLDSASRELASIRRKIKGAQGEIKSILEGLVRSKRESLQDGIITMRGNRYVLPVKQEHRGSIKGIIHDTSSSGATLFVEPLAVVEINNKIRELLSQEREEINRILAQLSSEIGNNKDVLLSNSDYAAKIDFLTAKGHLGQAMRGIKPLLNVEGEIHLKNARHPLIPKEKIVPVTISIGGEYSTLVITGPNTGGKTVSLKTCGLLTVMAMSGLLIPADRSSKINVFNDVMVDIGDEQSIEQNLSTFSSHMTKLVKMTEKAAPNVLILADELGSGTDPSEGAALAISLLEHFKDMGCTTMATTHYKELKQYALMTDGVENGCFEFDIDTLMPTYKLFIGIPGVSNAFAISMKLGLREEIIDRARVLLDKKDINFEEVARRTQDALNEAMRLEESARHEHKKALEAAKSIKEQERSIKEREKELRAEGRRKAQQYAEDVLDELTELLEDVKEKIRTEDAIESKRLLEEARIKIKSKRNKISEDISREAIDEFKASRKPDVYIKGRKYFITSLGMEGVLHQYSPEKTDCVVRIGNRDVHVPLESLRETQPVDIDNNRSHGEKKKTGRKRGYDTGTTPSKSMNVSTEIKLLGLNSDDAIMELDKFIDDAVLTGLSSLRVVHGKGTGILRNAVTNYLRTDKRVKSFRLGELGEGDSGVTIIQL